MPSIEERVSDLEEKERRSTSHAWANIVLIFICIVVVGAVAFPKYNDEWYARKACIEQHQVCVDTTQGWKPYKP